MSQVTLYLDRETEAAARTKRPLSRWFARLAEAEKNRLNRDRAGFWS